LRLERSAATLPCHTNPYYSLHHHIVHLIIPCALNVWPQANTMHWISIKQGSEGVYTEKNIWGFIIHGYHKLQMDR
jgi:hypothetical protein